MGVLKLAKEVYGLTSSNIPGKKGNPQLRLRLPPDHPIWSLPPGQRTERAREYLDLAAYLERRFTALEERLERLEGLLREGRIASPRQEDQAQERRRPDPEVWLKAWE